MGEATTGITAHRHNSVAIYANVCFPQCQHVSGCTQYLPLRAACCFVNADEGELLDEILKGTWNSMHYRTALEEKKLWDQNLSW